MQYLLKKLLIVLFLSNFTLLTPVYAKEIKVTLLLLDKSSSTKYEIEFIDTYNFRDLSLKLISCNTLQFDKYIDDIALVSISQNQKEFIGWFFRYTDELNLYSNKIYEISLLKCSIEN